MRTLITARIEPGELYQVAKKLGLSFTAAEQLNRLLSVDLAVCFEADGRMTSVDIMQVNIKDSDSKADGWPFRPRIVADERTLPVKENSC